MSGGHFDYDQFRLNDIADNLRITIAQCRTKKEYYDHYSDSFVRDMVDAYHKTRELEVILTRIDWVLSGDDGEDDYRERLEEEMTKIERDDPSMDEEILREREED